MDIDGGIQRRSYRLLSFFFVFVLVIGIYVIVNASLLRREVFFYKLRVLSPSSHSNSSNISASFHWERLCKHNEPFGSCFALLKCFCPLHQIGLLGTLRISLKSWRWLCCFLVFLCRAFVLLGRVIAIRHFCFHSIWSVLARVNLHVCCQMATWINEA